MAVRIPFLDLGAMHDEIRDDLDRVWTDTVDQSAFVGGDAVARFEAEFARYCGVGHCVGVANGTDALELVLRALAVGPGDEVVLPTNTFFATLEAVRLVGARPVLVDVDPATLLMRVDAAEAAITPRTAAVIAVHLFGQTVDLDAFADLSARTGVPLIEDAAQAHGARWDDRVAGSAGIAACFSFYPGKNLGALGDGGAVVTDDPRLEAVVRSLANHGRDPTSARGHGRVGRNSRLDGLQAGVLSAKLGHLDAWNARRRQIWDRYTAALAGTAAEPVRQSARATSVHHLAVVRVPERDEVRRRLAESGIATGVHYPVPCHRLPPFGPDEHVPLAVAERAAGEILSLPMYPQLSDGDVDTVAARLTEVLGEVRERSGVS
ncbi:MAG TPA: DegT/DnrJ/EryC1/StrS family aminotransferase [Acidimicrobiales bacterium]|nr:DegT/DnrJ/EryC1/StrS family aminotransferase [Acidimicrobiales bacterium]